MLKGCAGSLIVQRTFILDAYFRGSQFEMVIYDGCDIRGLAFNCSVRVIPRIVNPSVMTEVRDEYLVDG